MQHLEVKRSVTAGPVQCSHSLAAPTATGPGALATRRAGVEPRSEVTPECVLRHTG